MCRRHRRDRRPPSTAPSREPRRHDLVLAELGLRRARRLHIHVCDNGAQNCVDGSGHGGRRSEDPDRRQGSRRRRHGTSTSMTLDVTLSAPDPTDTVTVNYSTANGTALAELGLHRDLGHAGVQPERHDPDANPGPARRGRRGRAGRDLLRQSLQRGRGERSVAPNDQGEATIADEDPLASLSVSDATGRGERELDARVVQRLARRPQRQAQVTVGYVTTNGTASAPGDFESTAAQIAFVPGQTQKTVSVNVVGDTTFESDESFNGQPLQPDQRGHRGRPGCRNDPEQRRPLGMSCDVTGTSGADRLTGTAAGERNCGRGGNDNISGGGGDDEIFGDAGNDRISGDAGGDAVEGAGATTHCWAAPAATRSRATAATTCSMPAPATTRSTAEAATTSAAAVAATTCWMEGAGNDEFAGGGGSDRNEGGAGNDRLRGEAGNDFLDGRDGNDRLDGGAGNDRVRGISGLDLFTGGTGNDLLSGGGGERPRLLRPQVTVDLSKARARGEGRDRVLLVEVVTGTRAADTLIGNSARNVLNGSGGQGPDLRARRRRPSERRPGERHPPRRGGPRPPRRGVGERHVQHRPRRRRDARLLNSPEVNCPQRLTSPCIGWCGAESESGGWGVMERRRGSVEDRRGCFRLPLYPHRPRRDGVVAPSHPDERGAPSHATAARPLSDVLPLRRRSSDRPRASGGRLLRRCVVVPASSRITALVAQFRVPAPLVPTDGDPASARLCHCAEGDPAHVQADAGTTRRERTS